MVFCFIAVIYKATKGIYSIKKHQGYYNGDVPLFLNRFSSCADLIEESCGIAVLLWRPRLSEEMYANVSVLACIAPHDNY